ncbi:ATP synthase subunit C [Streptomyces sp. NBC_01451]|uniref:ATP synthase subunit C n=1 Tax=Streptomyces sp. NBC_01451 TaxID=2903872 RepID=UPI002E37F98F|nr:ATP synthase subunit C [Streptomyces sp. NBC_01451]
MADDDPYRWLDRAAAERLLSGEPLETSLESAGPEARDRAELLAKTLGALSVETPPGNAELPGEAAALAAFRKARPAPDLSTAAPATAILPASDPDSDMGLVRVGGFGRFGAAPRSGARKARWGRPLRLGLGAALAVGMVGSAAMAAGVAVLPNLFGGDEPGRPAATVSAGESRDPMRASPSPDATRGKGVPSLRPGSTAGGSFDKGAAGGDEPGSSPTGEGQESRSDPALPGDWRSALALSCRDMRSGKKLEAERRRALEKAAKGAEQVPQYCEDTLRDEPAVRSNVDTGTGTGAGGAATGPEDGQNGAGDTGGKGNGVSGGNGGGDGGGSGHGSGDGGGRGGRAAAKPTPTPTSFTALRADEPQNEPAPDPDPSYGVLPMPTAT